MNDKTRKYLLLPFFCVFCFCAGLFQISGVDTGFHIRTGEIVWTEGIIPSTNTFSSYCPDHPWMLHQWLPATAIYLVWSKLGLEGLIVIKALLGSLIFLLIFASSIRESRPGSGVIPAFIACTIAVILARVRLLERPYMLSAIFLAVIFYADRKYYHRRIWHMIALPLLMALWGNIHMGVIVGFQLLLILRAAKWIEWFIHLVRKLPKSTRPPAPINETFAVFLGMAATVAAVSFINPNGIAVLAAPIQFYLDPYWRTGIEELAPPTGTSLYMVTAFCVLLVSLQFAAWRRLDLALTLVAAYFFWLAFRTQRACLFLAVTTTPLLAKLLSEQIRSFGTNSLKKAALPLLPLCWTVLCLLVFLPDKTFSFGLGINRRYHPLDVFRFLHQHVPPQNLYNDMMYGGPMLWFTYPEFRPFVDGRGEAHALSFWRNTYEPLSQGIGWEPFFEKANLTGALLWNPKGSSRPLTSALLASPSWHLTAFDDNTMLFLKDTPANHDVLTRFKITQFKPDSHELQIASSNISTALNEALTALSITPSSIYWKTAAAKTMMLNGEFTTAESLFRELTAMKGVSYAYLRDHAYCLYMTDRKDEALLKFQTLASHPEQDGYPWYMQAVILSERKEFETAVQAINKAIEAAPENDSYRNLRDEITSGMR